MTIEVERNFGDDTDFSGTFGMILTMSTSASDSTYEVRENGVLVASARADEPKAFLQRRYSLTLRRCDAL